MDCCCCVVAVCEVSADWLSLWFAVFDAFAWLVDSCANWNEPLWLAAELELLDALCCRLMLSDGSSCPRTCSIALSEAFCAAFDALAWLPDALELSELCEPFTLWLLSWLALWVELVSPVLAAELELSVVV